MLIQRKQLIRNVEIQLIQDWLLLPSSYFSLIVFRCDFMSTHILNVLWNSFKATSPICRTGHDALSHTIMWTFQDLLSYFLVISPGWFLCPLSNLNTLWNIFYDTSQNRARLFKTNDVVTQHFVKISHVNISNMPIFFVEKMWEAFAMQKLLSFLQQKISVYLVIKL